MPPVVVDDIPKEAPPDTEDNTDPELAIKKEKVRTKKPFCEL
jgi:hypothetical protein